MEASMVPDTREDERRAEEEIAVHAAAVEENERIELERQIVLVTATKAIEAVVETLPASAVKELFAERRTLASDQKDRSASAIPAKSVALLWLAKAFDMPEFLKSVFANDPLAEARLRGLVAKRRLLQTEGGLVTAPELAERLNVARQTIHQRLQRGELFAVGEGDRKFPAWQAHGDKTLPGLQEVLTALDERDGMTKLVFFLTPDMHLGSQRPLDVLRRGAQEDIDRVVALAKRYGEHGAR